MSNRHYQEPSPDNRPFLMTAESTPGLYDGTSSESSASSPLHTGFENIYNAGYMAYPTFPYQYPSTDGLTPIGMIPVELDIEGIYEDHDRRRRKSGGSDKVVASHVHSRRRAQNRASQRAFRDRKEKHMKELEARLTELEGRHSELSRSYETLQVEYSSVKQELERQRRENEKLESSSGGSATPTRASTKPFHPNERIWEQSKEEMMDPLLFDVSAFCYDGMDDDLSSK
jgi:AP-1-like factor